MMKRLLETMLEKAEKESLPEWAIFYRDEIEELISNTNGDALAEDTHLKPQGIKNYLDPKYASRFEIIDDIEEEVPVVDVEAAIRKRTNDNLRSVFG